MSKVSLVVLAAGIGSRFGGGIKQLEPVGPNGEIILDYSVHDALRAGFDKIVFIIRKDIENDFKEIIGNRISEKAEVCYVYQEINKLPEWFSVPAGRTKPWGTAHALVCCKDIVKEPFAVINADDYYGCDAYKNVYNYLSASKGKSKESLNGCMAGFILKNTLSENGGVTRGICSVDKYDNLLSVAETKNIELINGDAVVKSDNGYRYLDKNSYVSMNMWGFCPEFINTLESEFIEFLQSGPGIKDECLIPIVIDKLIRQNKINIKLLKTSDKWFGVTYKEDIPFVIDSVKKLVESGRYN